MKKLLLPLIALSLVAGQMASAITLVDSGFDAFDGSASSHTITSAQLDNFDANGTDKLVVGVTGERSGATDNTVSGITYGGISLTQAVAGTSPSSTARKLSIWYLDDVSVTGDLVVSYVSAQSGYGVTAVALNGTTAGVADTALSGDSILTSTSGEFVFSAAIANGATISADAPLTGLLSSSDGSTGSSTGASGYNFVATSGTTFTPSFSGDEGYIAASFAVPEPSAFALLAGCFGLTWVMFRRRS